MSIAGEPDGPPVNAPSEIASLVAGAQRGNAGAFTALTRAYLRPAYAVALAIVGRPADAEDIAQEAMIVALIQIANCRAPERFGAWLLQIARNQARNWRRQRRLRDVAPDGERANEAPAPGAEGAAAEGGVLRRQLLAALELLPEQQREVVLLHDLEGWTHPEIAGALDEGSLGEAQRLLKGAAARMGERLLGKVGGAGHRWHWP